MEGLKKHASMNKALDVKETILVLPLSLWAPDFYQVIEIKIEYLIVLVFQNFISLLLLRHFENMKPHLFC